MNQTQDTQLSGVAPAVDDVDRTQAVPVPTAEPTSLSANVECPVCRTQNPPSERYCIDCGFLLGEEPEQSGPPVEEFSAGSLVTPDGAREFVLKRGENTIGRERTDVLLSHNSVSRSHAVIIVQEAAVLLEDLGSTNGTLVDGARIEPGVPVEIKDGSEIRFGSEALIYRAPVCVSDAAETTPAPQEAEPEAPEDISEVSQPASEAVGRLVSTDGSLQFELCAGLNRIGRRQGENDIVVPDPYVSGRHADLNAAEGVFTLTDVGSSNGTTLNGVGIEPGSPVEVKPGDEIGVGRTAFRLEVS